MGTISKNFSYREFEKSNTADALEICNVITTASVRDAVKALTLEVLQPLRDYIGLPVVISSGYRHPKLNVAVGGSPKSQHMKGEAADIYALLAGQRVPPEELARIIVALALPFDQLIIYPSFIHVSHRLNGKQRGRVMYDVSYKGPRL